MILLDANILMYAAGEPHANKEPSVELLRRIARGEVVAAIDAEVLQEVLHRYRAIDRWTVGRTVYDMGRRIIPDVVPITVSITDRARHILDEHPSLMARDALHASAAIESGAAAFCSYDRDFDVIDGIVRVEPEGI